MNESVDLTKVTYTTSGGRLLTMQDLIEHWDLHVNRLNDDLTHQVDDDHAWGAQDFLAALYVRQRLQGGIDVASGELKSELVARSAASDAVFRSLTEPDEKDVVARFAQEADVHDWWWGRAPRAGLPRRELDTWLSEQRQ